MDAWIIILITISSGVLILGLIMVSKNMKRKRQQHPNVLLSSPTFIPSTNSAPAYNTRQPATIFQTAHPVAGAVIMPQTHPQPYMMQQPQPYMLQQPQPYLVQQPQPYMGQQTQPQPYVMHQSYASNNQNNPNRTQQGRQLHPDSRRGPSTDDRVEGRPISSNFI